MDQNHPEIKLIALDMDGTLLNEEHEVPEENRAAIKAAKEKGVEVILSTGRSIATCRDHFKSLELSSYLITVNGSEIWDKNGEIVERNLVDTSLIEWMWELSKTHKSRFWATSSQRVWNDEMPEDLTTHEWLKFGFDVEDDKARELIMNELRKNGKLELSNSSPTNIEANAIGINKAKGIQTVCNLLGITMEQVMACGDSLNDLAMIKAVGLGVAMGNAQETVKKEADWVTGTNNEAGVAQAIHKWVLQK